MSVYRLKIYLFIAAAGLLIVFASGLVQKQHYSNTIVDVSWPNCLSKEGTEFNSGIVGVTDGLDFKPNPCLAKETNWFSHYSLYMNTGYPGKSYGIKFASYPNHCSLTNYACLAFNYGYNAAEYAINYSDNQMAHSRVWWVDVETDNSWTLSSSINRSVLTGTIDALKKLPFISKIGIYSSTGQWDSLTNSWHNMLPVWIGTGSTKKEIAIDSCNTNSFTGGRVLLSQYTKKVDIDISCNNFKV